MGFGFKFLSAFSGRKKKMKEKKSESFSLFRRTGSRYSFIGDKKKAEAKTNVEIQRLSWSNFPAPKSQEAPEGPPLQGSLASRRASSTENIMKPSKYFNKLTKSKSSILRSSASTMKNIFTGHHPSASVSSSVSSSSSCASSFACASTAEPPSVASSASSSPKVRQSWCSGVTQVLEKCGDEDSENASFSDEFHRYSNGSLIEAQAKRDIPVEVNKNMFLNIRNGFPISSLREEDEDDEMMIIPKIICAHKKAPDVIRRTRKQIVQDLEDIKHIGMLPEEINNKIISQSIEGEKENVNPNHEMYPYNNGELNLNAFKGYKAAPQTERLKHNLQSKINYDIIFNQNRTYALKQDILFDKAPPSDLCNLNALSLKQHSGEHSPNSSVDSSDVNEFFGSNLSALRESDISHETMDSSSANESSIYAPQIEDDDVDDNDSEVLTNDGDFDESPSFEKKLEEDLEMLDSSRERLESASALSDDEDKVVFRRKSKPILHIDIEKAKLGRTLSNDRTIRQLTSASATDSARSSRSSPRTPRSPAIDIDDLFKQRQRRIMESPKDNLTQVKDLTQRLRLETTSRPSSEWAQKARFSSGELCPPEAVVASKLEIKGDPLREKKQEQSEKSPKAEISEEERANNITNSLAWIREELLKMRQEDEHLARQLVSLQLEMQRLRLVRSCRQHEALLEEATCEEEDYIVRSELMTAADIDLPNCLRDCAFSSFKDFGVTRMNIANRRFTLR